VCSGAVTALGTLMNHGHDPFANPSALGRHQFWGDDE
jgi:hypothetical protein